MYEKELFKQFVREKIVNDKTTLDIEELLEAFCNFETSTYKLLNTTAKSLSDKLKRLFQYNLENKLRSISVNRHFLLEFGYKNCSICKEIKSIEEFYTNKNTATKLQSECIECVKNRNKKAYEKDSSYAKQNSKNWRENNRGKYNALMNKRRASELKATPKWLTKEHLEEIKKLYMEAAEQGNHVDHIIPLQSKLVCGLHVPWNLQILTPQENLKKSNKI